MINSILESCNRENKKVCSSYFVIISLIYIFILFHYIVCIYFFNDNFQNTLFIIGANASIYSLLYVGVLLFFIPSLLISKLNTSNNFYTMYFSVLFGFILNIMPIPLYANFTKIGFITLLFLIVIIALFIQKNHFIRTFKNLSITRIILIIIFSIQNFFSFGEILFMGGHINRFL